MIAVAIAAFNDSAFSIFSELLKKDGILDKIDEDDIDNDNIS